jgi:hypothetical protein
MALLWKLLVYLMPMWCSYFMNIWYILRSFGVLRFGIFWGHFIIKGNKIPLQYAFNE